MRSTQWAKASDCERPQYPGKKGNSDGLSPLHRGSWLALCGGTPAEGREKEIGYRTALSGGGQRRARGQESNKAKKIRAGCGKQVIKRSSLRQGNHERVSIKMEKIGKANLNHFIAKSERGKKRVGDPDHADSDNTSKRMKIVVTREGLKICNHPNQNQ